MKRMVGEAAFQIALFAGIVAIGFGTEELLKSAGVDTLIAKLVGSAVTTTLITTMLLKWSRILERFWPRPTK